MSDQQEPSWGPVMPFSVVASKGGPYEDGAYTAGYEAGLLDARLRFEHPATLGLPIHAENVPQVDLLAMRHGYTITAEADDGGWAWVELAVIPPA